MFHTWILSLTQVKTNRLAILFKVDDIPAMLYLQILSQVPVLNDKRFMAVERHIWRRKVRK